MLKTWSGCNESVGKSNVQINSRAGGCPLFTPAKPEFGSSIEQLPLAYQDLNRYPALNIHVL